MTDEAELQEWIQDTIKQLPLNHRMALRGVSIHVEIVDRIESYSGIEGQAGVSLDPGDGVIRFQLERQTMEALSEEACKFIIGHELAHAILGHHVFLNLMESISDESVTEIIEAVLEEQADYYAAVIYGFKNGAIEFVKTFGGGTSLAKWLTERDHVEMTGTIRGEGGL